MGKSIDITGQRFGRLVAIRDIGKDKHRMRVWECMCDCGTITTARAYDLMHGDKKSCGCYKLDLLAIKREKWIKMKMTQERRERREPMEIHPITEEIKTSFNDWWMFGERQAIARLRKMFR